MLCRLFVLVCAIVSLSPANAQDAVVAKIIPRLDALTRAEALRTIRHAESSVLYETLAPIRRGQIKEWKELEEIEKHIPGFFSRAAFSYRALTLLAEKQGFSNVAAVYRARADIFNDRRQGKIDFSEFTKREVENNRAKERVLTPGIASPEKDSPPTDSKKVALAKLGDALGQSILQAAVAEFPPSPGQDQQGKARLTGYGRISRDDNLTLFFLLGTFQLPEGCERATKTFADDVLASAKAAARTAKVEMSACDARVPSGSEYEALQKGGPVDHYVLFTGGLTVMFAHGGARLEDERVACEKMLATVQATKPTANCYRPSPATAQSSTPQPAPAQAATTHEAIAKAASEMNGLSRSEILRGIRGAEKEVAKDLETTVADAQFLTENEKDMAAIHKRAAFCHRALTSLLEKNQLSNIAAIYRARAELHEDILQGRIGAAQFAKREKENEAAKLRAVTVELATLDKKTPPTEGSLRSLERLGSALGQIILAAVHSEQGDVPYVHAFNQGMLALSKSDYPTVAKHLRPLAERGDRRAQFWVGYMHLEGLSLPQDFSEAQKWLQRSADQGESPAQYQLARVHAERRGVPRDLVSAYMWLSIAASRGYEKSAKARDELGAHLTPAQIALAKKRASEWKPKLPPGATINRD